MRASTPARRVDQPKCDIGNDRVVGLGMFSRVWIFGYGSLIFRPSFPYVERAPAWLEGFSRRFWQGSTDHRGMPEAPGRVVTLIEEVGVRCLGMAYRIAEAELAAVLEHLDDREKGGYERRDVMLDVHEHGRVSGVVYFAGPTNPHWLGPASVDEIAAHVRGASGPSGTNADYARRLAAALRELKTQVETKSGGVEAHPGADDTHVQAIANAL